MPSFFSVFPNDCHLLAGSQYAVPVLPFFDFRDSSLVFTSFCKCSAEVTESGCFLVSL